MFFLRSCTAEFVFDPVIDKTWSSVSNSMDYAEVELGLGLARH